ncbi:MAG TPA: protein kinase [Polyangiaceae bacterium]|nr:protein kinase [Polyangiaceae bacterium]
MKSQSSSPQGRRFGDYRIVRLLARGGMGRVYEAEHAPSGRLVALKLPDASTSSDATALQRFKAEGRLLDSVRHPNIVQVFEVGVEGDSPFIVMELLKGETLRAKVERQGPLSRREVVELFIPICDAVATLHDTGIVHRDLKLCNVMLAERPSGTVPMILDFGISKDLVAGGGTLGPQTQSGAFVGTPRYLSPEQTLNPKAASALSDQYAVGIMLYEAVTGRSPFAAEVPYALMHAILTAPVVPPSEVEPRVAQDLDAIVLRAMARDPKERFPSLRALARALRELTASPRTSQPPERRAAFGASRTPPASALPHARLGRAADETTTVRSGGASRPGVSPPSSRPAEARASALPAPLVPTEPFHEVMLIEPHIVLVRRSARNFANAGEVMDERRRIGTALDQLGRDRKRLLVDSRRAPLSTDDRLASEFMALREEIGRGFERTAVVVGSKIGILQANRLNRETTLDGALAAFENDRDALVFLKK